MHTILVLSYSCKVLVLYEAKVLDSIQFLFDLGFVPPVALPPYRTPPDRAAVVEAVRRQINRGGQQGDPLLLSAWPSGPPARAAAAASGGGDGADRDRRSATPLGLRVLGTSRCERSNGWGCIARTLHVLYINSMYCVWWRSFDGSPKHATHGRIRLR